MNIETKFSAGDKVWYVEEKEVEQPCKYCDGTGKVQIKDKKFRCPNCGGSGKAEDKIISFVAGQITIEEIKVWCLTEVVGVKYYDTNGYRFFEEDCFATREEAEADCVKRNNGEK